MTPFNGAKIPAGELAHRIARFRDLHKAGCFLCPNPWDIGSARALEAAGYPALATTSAGTAWSLGYADYAGGFNEMVASIERICQAVRVPVTADFENGFADDLNELASNIRSVIDIGVCGFSIEDSPRDPKLPLYDLDYAVERIRVARQVVDQADSGVILTARCEGLLNQRLPFDDVLHRLTAFAEAGADCLFAPGTKDEEQVKLLVATAGDRPVNTGAPALPFTTLEACGVRRVSVGGALAANSYGALLRAIEEMKNTGTFSYVGENREVVRILNSSMRQPPHP